MKKKLVFMLFGVGFLLLGAAFISSIPKNEEYYQEQNIASSPLNLSDICMEEYVSLPVFEGMEIEESTMMEDDAVARKEAYQEILRTADKLTTPNKNCTIICDMTISKDKEFLDKCADQSIGTKSRFGVALMKNLEENLSQENVRMEWMYNDIEDATYDIVIKEIYDIPFPITNDYMRKHTQYESFSSMVRSYSKSKLDESRISQREETMNNLIDYSIKKTTFMELPESLYDKEFEFLKREYPEVQYDAAKDSLKKIFFIGAVLKQYSLADDVERERVVAKYEADHSIVLEGYERERMSYLLFEEDVNNYLYKIVNIKEITVTEDSSIPSIAGTGVLD